VGLVITLNCQDADGHVWGHIPSASGIPMVQMNLQGGHTWRVEFQIFKVSSQVECLS
jgi:hypothetical protein